MRSNRFNGVFPTTCWDLVEQAAEEPVAKQRAGRLDELLERYRSPLLAHLVFSKGIAHDQAEDLLQSFVAQKILKMDLLSRADRTRGKFRTFLLTSLNNYVISEFRKSQSLRKSPGVHALLPLDAVAEQVEHKGTPDVSNVFDLAWVREVILETLRRVQKECENTKRKPHWILFEDRLVNPALHGTAPLPYAEMVGRLGFSSPIQAANAVFTVKRIFERNFRAVIEEYAGDKTNVESEINELYAILDGLNA
jgi:RNA polymerase sigma-70 factor (ECF subfamily)